MVRGTPGVKRSRTISVRVSEAEWAVWEAAREASGRAEMGAWVRAVVADVLDGSSGLPGPDGAGGSTRGSGRAPGRAGDVPRVPQVNADAYAHLVGAAGALDRLTRAGLQRGRADALAGQVSEAVREVVAAARAVRGLPQTVAPAARPAARPVARPAAQPGPGLGSAEAAS